MKCVQFAPQTVQESTSPAKKRIDVTPAPLDDYKTRLMKEVEDNEKERRKKVEEAAIKGIWYCLELSFKKIHNLLVLERAEERQTRGQANGWWWLNPIKNL